MALTVEQIKSLLQHARESGMSEPEVEGLRDVLMTRAQKPNAADKLRMAIDVLPKDQRESMTEFVGEMDGITDRIGQRGRAALEAISDDEWAALVEGNEND